MLNSSVMHTWNFLRVYLKCLKYLKQTKKHGEGYGKIALMKICILNCLNINRAI